MYGMGISKVGDLLDLGTDVALSTRVAHGIPTEVTDWVRAENNPVTSCATTRK